jgi:flagellum-specific ATP synthase
MRQALAAYRDAEDLIQLGAYVAGSNPQLDASIRLRPDLIDFLRQDHATDCPIDQTLARMEQVAAHLDPAPQTLPAKKVDRKP